MTLLEFVSLYAPEPPRIPAQNPDQLRPLTSADGVVDLALGVPLPAAAMPGTPNGRCLWVIVPGSVPAIIEAAPQVRQPLQSGVAKHTNLTGGAAACCGGECWTDAATPNRLLINGGSGRYPPRSARQLADAATVFQTLGYEVTNAGWDEDNDRPARVFRG